jgi:hypothetical protein
MHALDMESISVLPVTTMIWSYHASHLYRHVLSSKCICD